MTFTSRIPLGLVCVLAFVLPFGVSSQSVRHEQGRAELVEALNMEATRYTADRRAVIARIKTKAEAIERQKQVRAKILELIGGLPKRTPLNPKVLGETKLVGFRIEKILLESQPGFYVTGLLYIPQDGLKKHAGIVMAPGHGASGKAGEANIAAAFARNGFVVFSYDPIGQGERLQYPDPKDSSKSIAERPTGEHGETGLQPVLLGDAPAQYWVWDGIRAVDYLSSRPEVDPSRIGAFGCSGGGTITALTSAMDQRVAATAVACYNTSFDTLLASIGPQDNEQSTPGFIAAGLDFPDWIELVAPRPYAAVATYDDMFPFRGARVTVQEARHFYALFDPSAAGTGDEAKTDLPIPSAPALNVDTSRSIPPSAPVQFITGPGRHGALAPIMKDILAFFVRNLSPNVDPGTIQVPSLSKAGDGTIPAAALQVTPTGQLASSYPDGQTVHTLNLQRMQKVKTPEPKGAALLQAVRTRIHAKAKPRAVRFDSSLLQSTSGEITLPLPDKTALRGRIHVPADGKKHPAVLMLVPDSMDGTSNIAKRNRARFDELKKAGNIVLAITPRPSYPGTDDMKARILGPFYLLGLRAELLNHTLLGLRTDDVIAAVDYLAARTDVDVANMDGEADGHMATVLDHAALFDTRLHHITTHGGLVSYRSLVQAQMPIGAPEDIVPGVLLYYDLPSIRSALGTRLSASALQAGDEDLSLYSTPMHGLQP